MTAILISSVVKHWAGLWMYFEDRPAGFADRFTVG